jgi:hypothetical protein
MAVMYYWTGTEWSLVASGGGGDGTGTGPQGPPGADGISVEVYGPQPTPPLNPRKGDHWLAEPARSGGTEMTGGIAMPGGLQFSSDVVVKLLPDPPKTVYVTYLS